TLRFWASAGCDSVNKALASSKIVVAALEGPSHNSAICGLIRNKHTCDAALLGHVHSAVLLGNTKVAHFPLPPLVLPSWNLSPVFWFHQRCFLYKRMSHADTEQCPKCRRGCAGQRTGSRRRGERSSR